MNNIKKFIIFLLVLFISVPAAFSENKIVYLDLDSLVSNTKAGKTILNRLEKSKISDNRWFFQQLQCKCTNY